MSDFTSDRRLFILGGASFAVIGMAAVGLPSRGVIPTVNGRTRDLVTLTGSVNGSANYQFAIEENGWVLSIVGSWEPARLIDFALDPDGSARVILRVRSRGYVLDGQWARPASHVRTIVATKALRVSGIGNPPDFVSLDEERLSETVGRVRLALSGPVHRDDVIDGLELLDNWMRNQSGRLNGTVTNGSTYEPEIPSMRWAVPSLMRATRSEDLRLDMLVASAWAMGKSAVAAIRFIASDGNVASEKWVVRASTSEGWGDDLRCWGISAVDLCEGLSHGPVTVHAEIYPWIGAMRSTGAGHSTDQNAGFNGIAEQPLHLLWDPNGTHIPECHVCVDWQSGSLNPGDVTVAENVLSAKNGIVAKTVSVACQAIALKDRRIPAANGWPDSKMAGDGATITLLPGRQRFGTHKVSSGSETRQCRIIIQGELTSVDGSDRCILEIGDRPNLSYSAYIFRDFDLNIGGSSLPNSPSIYHFQNLTVSTRPGFENSRSTLFSNAGNSVRVSIFNCDWTRALTDLRGTNMRIGIIRGCRVYASASAPVIVGNTWVDNNSGISPRLQGLELSSVPSVAEDQFIWGNLCYSLRKRAIAPPRVKDSRDSRKTQIKRWRVVNNVFEMVSKIGATHRGDGNLSSTENFFGIEGFSSAENCLLEGNTFVGQRVNWAYNAPYSSDIALQSRHIGNVLRNNYFDHIPTKHDDFFLPGFGRRPGFVKSWSVLYGNGMSNNAFGRRWSSNRDFEFEFYGIKSRLAPTSEWAKGNEWVMFEDDRSQLGLGLNQGGAGSYKPLNDSPLCGLCEDAVIDSDVFGNSRNEMHCAGAIENSGPNLLS